MSRKGLQAVIAGIAIIGGYAVQAQTPIPPSPKDFALDVSHGNQYEILAANVAEIQAKNPRVRKFAEEMVRDHDRLAQDLRQAAKASGLPPLLSSMSSDQASLLSSLQGARGADFEKAYARQQVLVHAQAIAIEESFATAGADPNLRKVAQAALPIIKDHLKKARQLAMDVGAT